MTVKTTTVTSPRSSRRAATRVAVAIALALAACLALTAAPAGAATTRVLEGAFNGADSPGGAFSFGPFGGAAVDNSGGPSAGDVYVGEASYFTRQSRVVKFDSAGVYAGVEFNGADTPAGSFGFLSFAGSLEPGGLAVDSSSGPNSGDVYVADPVHRVIDRFNEEGEFVCQISGTVPADQAEEEAECAGATGSAVPDSGFLPTGIAVNPVNGEVYVGDYENKVIDEFNGAGEYVGQITDSHLTNAGSSAFPVKLAVDSNGNVYVAMGLAIGAGTYVLKFDSAGNFVDVLDEKQPAAVAVDPSTNHVFVYEGETNQLVEYSESGDALNSFGGRAYKFPPLLGASTAGQVYAVALSFAGSTIEIYSPPVVVPDATAKAPSAVEETSATLNGEVDPVGGGEVESCEFEYGPTTEYGSTIACSPATPYAGVTAVSAEISSLQPSSTYHYRLVAKNANGGAVPSQDEVLYTKGAPTIDALSATEIERNSAEIEATVNPHGYSTEWTVEYLTEAEYNANPSGDKFAGAQSTTATIGSQLTPQTVSAELAGLEVETSYRYRVVATNSIDSAESSAESFTTVPVVELQDLYPSAENTSALLRENVNPLGLDTTCRMEYVTDATFQESEWAQATVVPCTPADLGSGSSLIKLKNQITGLSTNTTYHSRFAFSNTSGASHSPDRVFTTFGLSRFEMKLLDEEGNPVTQAGAHPYEYLTEFEVNENEWGPPNSTSTPESGATATLKDIHTELPPGLIGNPNGLPQCPQRLEESYKCPADTQVGRIEVGLVGESGRRGPGPFTGAPVFNLVPPKGVAAKFGAVINIGISAYIEAGVRTGKDYGINADSLNITSFANAGVIKLRLWGNPGDEGHTTSGERSCPSPGEESFYQDGCSPPQGGLTNKPFLSLPTSCTGAPLTVGGSVDTYQEPDNPVSINTELPEVTGCNAIEFHPSLEARPSTNVADSPSGLHVDLHMAQNEDELGLRVADLRDAKVTLPPGLVVNPSGANGLVGCSAGDFDEHGSGPANCPDQSKIGTVEVDTPLVGHPLPGAVYIAKPYENPFNSLLAIYVAVDDPITGVIIKLAGHVEADPQTGQLTTTFDENPQLPFEDFKFDFFSGAKAPLRTPAVCGKYDTTSVMTPWSAPDSGPAQTPADHYEISQSPTGGACPTSAAAMPNAPGFDAGTIAPTAGKYSPLVLHLRREDGSQEFEKLTVTPPPGLLAKLAGTTYCSDAALAAAASRPGAQEAASPSCPSSSEVGTVTVGAGAGPAPYYVQGHAYLTGPYKGAPIGLAIVTPATAGPYDLGTVVVRAALFVDPVTTKVTAVSDPIPHILQGIPLDIRSIALELGKPEFTLNPTSCDASKFEGQLGTTLGQSASLSNPFQLGDCTNLGFKPKLATRLFGPTGRTAHPKLQAKLTMPAGGANISRAVVTLPHSEFLDQSHIRTVCTRVQYAANACPPGAVYGFARAYSPLLAQPLEGPVYLRSSEHKLPDLVADLNGQIHVDLDGRIDSIRGGIRTTFETVPDAPVSKFTLTMQGGKKGLLQNSVNICRGKHRVNAQFDAHSGRVSDSQPLLQAKCPGQAKKHGKHQKKKPAKHPGKR